ncbi:MAG: hypothetical protein HRU39_00515 [Salinicola sp.]|uniref:acetyl-CoA carboxylase biotin carboxyl carrier protein n=1 Tax=Salinicola sp. TaxID=1978524 RepID=UPI001DC65801|nr:biotin/lipoyl-containing protein [Salinicola sp.]NRB54451.1 hypothetical protein [Salinicola sp.]
MNSDTLPSLCRAFDESGLAMLDWRAPGYRVRLIAAARHSSQRPPTAPPAVANPAGQSVLPETKGIDAGLHAVASPGVGRVRFSHPLMEGALAGRGAAVEAGDVIALIQVGPLMLPVHAGLGGTITARLVDEGDAVDFDAPLLYLKPSPPAR